MLIMIAIFIMVTALIGASIEAMLSEQRRYNATKNSAVKFEFANL